MHHQLKIQRAYLIRILAGEKTFEMRMNDRDYQVGDTIEFYPIPERDSNAYEELKGPFPFYEITYIHMGIGVEPGFSALAIRQVRNA